ncbi:N-carbamoyl-L-amino-acid hydrolase [Alkalihalobacillus xiaoxiensis]|uniref:N-carbamoyl-L-amino-acid hydrolase n=1 Tax=Shouchella xiaoxiensis TaxID=766895 RepID=A0ABS2SMX5_9BACI|nr:Zn-dependent hydrolase [Shouchella xiaoxiensis]MBM7836864.1 N-carbamoyl-L-amino-acid hydrolase [Shouchella xiaoxiensis]
MEKLQLRINRKRLEQSIHTLGAIGVNEHGGLDRTTFTDAELAARDWLKKELERTGLALYVDEAANIWGRREGKNQTKSMVFGSHIDTVPNGGKYDGALGVLIALEIMNVLQEEGVQTKHPFELVSFSAEEPNPFGLSTFGSRAISGKLTAAHLVGVKDVAGTLVTDALTKAGGNPDQFDLCVRSKEDFAAYVEVHIEQGKRLLNTDIPIGVVTAITGIYREEVRINGVANHAGTTLMEDRSDALVAAAQLISALEEICKTYPAKELVGTIGKLDTYPNSANIIPGEVVLAVEIRGETVEQIAEARALWDQQKADISQKRDIRIEASTKLNQAPAQMSDTVMEVSEREAKQLGLASMRLGSMAGHDAAHMASLTKSGMIFVPSLDGKSHCPEEESRMSDIEKAANVLLQTLLTLDEQED